MNRGAWELTEEIIECYRDIDELLVMGGVIWSNNPDDDYFIHSHGIKTPDAVYPIVYLDCIVVKIRQDKQVINSKRSVRTPLRYYRGYVN